MKALLVNKVTASEKEHFFQNNIVAVINMKKIHFYSLLILSVSSYIVLYVFVCVWEGLSHN